MDILDIISKIVCYPLAYVLAYCYFVVRSYGLAIILFTIIIKACLIPLGIKQQKSMLLQVKYQPKMAALQAQYKNDKPKLQEEMSKLYKEEGYNPLGGCLPLLIQMPILFGLYNVITHPLTYINGMFPNEIQRVANTLGITTAANSQKFQIDVATAINDNFESVKNLLPQNYMKLNFNFLGLNLSGIPNYQKPSILWLIPIVAALTGLAMSIITQRYTVQNAQSKGMSKSLMFMSPAMSLFFTFTFPAGVGLYWIMSNITGAVQAYVLGEKFNPKKYAEQLKQEEQDKKTSEKLVKKEKRLNKGSSNNNNKK